MHAVLHAVSLACAVPFVRFERKGSFFLKASFVRLMGPVGVESVLKTPCANHKVMTTQIHTHTVAAYQGRHLLLLRLSSIRLLALALPAHRRHRLLVRGYLRVVQLRQARLLLCLEAAAVV